VPSPRRPLPAAAFHTLGCKLNQHESEALAAAFRDSGFPVSALDERGLSGDGPGLIIINTCTVTSKAEQKARRVIRKSLRGSAAAVIVTGCYAQVERAALEALDEGGRLFVLPGGGKARLLELPAFLAARQGEAPADGGLPRLLRRWLDGGAEPEPAAPDEDAAFRFAPADFVFHSRAFLKIQDGCDNRCAFCRVREARGAGRSLPPETAAARLAALEERGFAEAALTGVNIGQYRSGGLGLGGLLTRLLESTRRIRLRLSSLEPECLTDDFTRALASPRVRPHFHLSVQSGSPAVLARMGRPCPPEAILEGAARLRAVKDDPFLACDIITGFPGETAADFALTRELCRRAGFAGIHAFPFSPRPGTAAWNLRPRVSEREAGERVRTLLEDARLARRAYLARWQGREVEAVILHHEGGGSIPPGAHAETSFRTVAPHPPLLGGLRPPKTPCAGGIPPSPPRRTAAAPVTPPPLSGGHPDFLAAPRRPPSAGVPDTPPVPETQDAAFRLPALSENYLKLLVLFPSGAPPPPPGSLLRCRLLPSAVPPPAPFDIWAAARRAGV
jgi:threonylcarbamoyladenosine tRNA methylthiotransferase MtaB